MEMDIEMIAMSLIGHAGESKSYSFQALREAKVGNFEEADSYIKKANEEMLKAHEIQTDLITKEAGGEKVELGLIMVHAQDHLMTAMLLKDLTQHFINLYRKSN